MENKKNEKVDADELAPEISFVVPHHLGVSQEHYML
jgi:hypothetical protein